MNFPLIDYTFGLKHKGYNNVVNGEGYPYRYNGKEWQDELGLNWYDYGFRNYDAALGRWMSIDNLAEQYTSYSPYQYAGNNPIFNFDIDGNEFTEGAEKEAGKLVHKAVRSIYDLASTICKLEDRINNTDDEKKIKKLRKRIKGLQSEISRFENVVSEINELRESDVLYDVQFSDEPLNGEGDSSVAYGETTYEDGKVVMTVYKQKGVYGSDFLSHVAHEFKHAFQFDNGELGFDDKIGGMNFYSIFTEREANDRAALFGTRTNTREKGFKEKIRISNSIEAQRISKKHNTIIRYNGHTYSHGKQIN